MHSGWSPVFLVWSSTKTENKTSFLRHWRWHSEPSTELYILLGFLHFTTFCLLLSLLPGQKTVWMCFFLFFWSAASGPASDSSFTSSSFPHLQNFCISVKKQIKVEGNKRNEEICDGWVCICVHYLCQDQWLWAECSCRPLSAGCSCSLKWKHQRKSKYSRENSRCLFSLYPCFQLTKSSLLLAARVHLSNIHLKLLRAAVTSAGTVVRRFLWVCV